MRSFLLGVVWLICIPLGISTSHAVEHGVVVLQYHHVGDDTPRVTSVTAVELAQHFGFLVENDFNVISLSQAQKLITSGEPVPDKTVAITFDDGWRNLYDNGLQVFKQFNLPFTVFVNPELMAESPHLYLSWQQLSELADYGASVANHSSTHTHMTWQQAGESKSQWLERQKKDVLAAQAALDSALDGEQPQHFAYPYGEFNPQLAALLEQLDFIAFGQHSGPWGANTPSAAIPRFPASGHYANLTTLKTKLLSLPLPARTVEPASMVLEKGSDEVAVELSVRDIDDFSIDGLNCFYQGQQINPTKQAADASQAQGWQLSLTLEKPPLGRSRVNCTVASQSAQGRFYWYSVPLVRPNEQGRWPD